MLNVFPIQFLAPLAYTLLRICVGAILLRLGFIHIKNRSALHNAFSFPYLGHGSAFAFIFGVGEILIGSMFILGFFTQIAGIFCLIMSIKILIMRSRLSHPLIPQPLFYILLSVVSISLIITGAGIFAFDLPI